MAEEFVEDELQEAPLSAEELFEQHKAEIEAAFEEKGFFRRMADMLTGLSKPHSSAEFKIAKTELQRLIAPIAAITLPVLGVAVLIVVTAVQGQMGKKIEVEDNTVAAFKFDKPAMGYIECGWTSVAGFYGLEIMGDKGAVLANYAEEKTILTQGGFTPDGKFETKSEVIGTLTVEAWENQMAKLIEAELKEEPFPTSIDDGIKALKVALAIYDSAKTGRTIEL